MQVLAHGAGWYWLTMALARSTVAGAGSATFLLAGGPRRSRFIPGDADVDLPKLQVPVP